VFPLAGVVACGGLLFFVDNRTVWLAFLAYTGLGLAIYGFYGHRRAHLRASDSGEDA
jgi:hypothetical protein